MVEDLLGSAAALDGMARHQELGLLSAAEASLPLAGSTYLPAEAMELRLRTPVSKILLPRHPERVRVKLAENIQELWVMNKIEVDWQYVQGTWG
ncbi:ryanodine receptor 2-like isoform X1 [Ictidomys tridecemlineatus]